MVPEEKKTTELQLGGFFHFRGGYYLRLTTYLSESNYLQI